MDVDTLLIKATGGLALNRRKCFRPSMLYTLLEIPFNTWCDYHAPRSAKVDETSRYEQWRMDLGSAYEAEWIRKNHPDAVEIPQTYDLAALRASLESMLRGDRIIHAPQLWLLPEEMYGMADVLVRHDDHPSDLGAWHYRVIEIKRSKKVETSPDADDYRVLQAYVYHRILSRVQGYAPPHFTMVLREGRVDVPPAGFEESLAGLLAEWREIRDNARKPEVPDFDKGKSPWRVFASKIQETARDVTLASGISGHSREKLSVMFNVRTADELDRLSIEDLARALGDSAGPQAWYRLEAKRQGQPVVAPGAQVVLPRRKRHLYFDFETCDSLHPTIAQHVYMIGLYDWERQVYKAFTARGAEEEERIFREFIAYVGVIEDAALYHWAAFETETMLKEVAPRHPALAADLERVVKSCVDLKEAIKDKVYFATRTYSIKEVAPTIGFHWKQSDVDAYESMMLYWDFLGDDDVDKVARIIQYNKDDCEAMVAVDRWLQDQKMAPNLETRL